ncbi:7016_t:CDS:1, partial [Dentiscutata erythropus]
IDELDYDNPLMSSILDTSEPHEWLKNGFSKSEWESDLNNKNGLTFYDTHKGPL